MTRRQLAPALTALIHHVELNESGWWKKAFGQLIQAVLWQEAEAQSLQALHTSVTTALGVHIQPDVLEAQLKSLSGRGTVHALPNGTYKLTEKSRAELTTANEQATKQREECKEIFLRECEKHCPGVDSREVWRAFIAALSNTVMLAGANLYNLLSGASLEKEENWVDSIVAKFDPILREGLYATFSSFFSVKNPACRAEVLRLMSAYFFAEASQLSPATLAAIEAGRAKKIVKVVLDTNFIFSVLQLHDNPANDAVISLLALAKSGGKHIDLRLQVLPSTLEEAQRTLHALQKKVEHFRVTMAMARAAVDQPLPSVVRKYLETVSKNKDISAEAYFRPYVEDLRMVLLSKGISVLEAHPAIYNSRQDVIDDVLEQTRREDAELPENRRKGYDAWLHDVVLWHAVHDKRGTTNSPFETEYWVVSIDWRFLSFDRHKRQQKVTPLPVVLYPTNLVQLTQFWVPRSEALEASIVSSIQLPMFSRGFDVDDERATMKVLGALSRFENLDDLDEAAVRAILTNRALRSRLADGVESTDGQLELIREELITLHKNAVNQLMERSEALASTAKERDDEQSRRKERELELGQKSASLTEMEEQNRVLSQRLSFIWFALIHLVLPSITGVFLAIAAWFIFQAVSANHSSIALWLSVTACLLFPLALSAAISSWRVPRQRELQNSRLATRFAWLGKKAVVPPIVLGVTAIFQGGVWDWVKSIFQ